MAIPGTTPITAPIAQTSDEDNYAAQIDNRGKGGIHSKATTGDRDAIKASHRSAGMLCFVVADLSMYQLQDDLVTWKKIWMLVVGDVNHVTILSGVGNPEGVVTAAKALYIDETSGGGLYFQNSSSPSNVNWEHRE